MRKNGVYLVRGAGSGLGETKVIKPQGDGRQGWG